MSGKFLSNCDNTTIVKDDKKYESCIFKGINLDKTRVVRIEARPVIVKLEQSRKSDDRRKVN